jgi:hypothetical protein
MPVGIRNRKCFLRQVFAARLPITANQPPNVVQYCPKMPVIVLTPLLLIVRCTDRNRLEANAR